jgi:hypothetical protein
MASDTLDNRTMRRFRFHIGSLLIVIILLGIGFAALRESNDLWDSSVFTVTLGALLVSVLLAIHRNGLKRAFWIGFAIFGWVYLGLTSVPWIESRLLTTKVLAYFDSKIPGRPQVITGQAWGGPANGRGQSTRILDVSSTDIAIAGSQPIRVWDAGTGRLLGSWGGTTENFLRIGHSLLTIIAAWLGGGLSRYLARNGARPEPGTGLRAPEATL